VTVAGKGLVLGLSGFFGTAERELVPDLPRGLYHDAAACLVAGDTVIAAVEEERISRRKHTNLFPLGAARACLEQAGVSLAEVAEVAFFFTEAHTDFELGLQYLRHPDRPARWARELIVEHLEREFGPTLDPARIHFARHHDAHAASAFAQSGLTEALVVVMDGEGDDESVSVFRGASDGLRLVRSHPKQVSLGHFYRKVTELLGYALFDEGKVMGLAPYGDPARFRDLLGSLLRLLPEGRYELDVEAVQRTLLAHRFRLRRTGEPFSQAHKDLAAAAQETLERIVLHLLEYWRAESSLPALCLAGGVAQNSSLNGRVLSSGLFADMFVDPASHDAGAALGAAMLSSQRPLATPSLRPLATPSFRPPPRLMSRGVYWGPDIGDRPTIRKGLERWHRFVEWQYCDEPGAATAKLLASGAVVGWAQGRSEFGPRALGNRSILADPRPADNWQRINQLVKERESYRPLAPAVLDSAASDWFELPPTRCPLDYMGCVVNVRPDRRHLLGAVTHVDGTARVQVVRKEANTRFWWLISQFAELTGVPVLLNTSFNNNAEPIVQSAEDAIACFLTTRLDRLVLGDFIVSRRQVTATDYLELVPSLLPNTQLITMHADGSASQDRHRHLLRPPQHGARSTTISHATHRVLVRSGGQAPVNQLLDSAEHAEPVVAELRALWAQRLVGLEPGS